MSDPELRETARSYDRIVDSYEAQATNAPPARTAFVDQFIDRVRPSGVVLDAGCGPGHDVSHFVARGLDAFGIDTSIGMARRAFERGQRVAVADIRRPPLAAGSIDALWSSASLLHVPRPDVASTLASWKGLLRPGGLLGLITSLGGDEGWEAVPYAVGTQHGDVPLRRWFVHHERNALEKAIRESGFLVAHSAVREAHRQWLQLVAVNID